jgi:hypothetical protein
MNVEQLMKWELARETKYSEETKNSTGVTLSTTNPIRSGPGTNQGRRGEKPGNNRLRYGTFLIEELRSWLVFRQPKVSVVWKGYGFLYWKHKPTNGIKYKYDKTKINIKGKWKE